MRLWDICIWNLHSSFAALFSTLTCHLSLASEQLLSLEHTIMATEMSAWEFAFQIKQFQRGKPLDHTKPNRMVSLHLLCSPWESETTFKASTL